MELIELLEQVYPAEQVNDTEESMIEVLGIMQFSQTTLAST